MSYLSALPNGPPVFRGRESETFSESRMREMRPSGFDENSKEVTLLRWALALLVFLVLSMVVVATGPVLVAQGAVPSQKPPFAAGQIVARTARPQQMPAPLVELEKMGLVAGLILQGIAFLAFGFLWTKWSQRRRPAVTEYAGNFDATERPASSIDVEDSPVGVA